MKDSQKRDSIKLLQENALRSMNSSQVPTVRVYKEKIRARLSLTLRMETCLNIVMHKHRLKEKQTNYLLWSCKCVAVVLSPNVDSTSWLSIKELLLLG